MTDKTIGKRILETLRTKYPGKDCFDLDGRGLHFVCETEPTAEHPEYDKAIEVIIESRPHKHLKMTQYYTVLSGSLEFHLGEKALHVRAGDTFTVPPGVVHWATSADEAMVEIHSKPGWTKEDHIVVEL